MAALTEGSGGARVSEEDYGTGIYDESFFEGVKPLLLMYMTHISLKAERVVINSKPSHWLLLDC